MLGGVGAQDGSVGTSFAQRGHDALAADESTARGEVRRGESDFTEAFEHLGIRGMREGEATFGRDVRNGGAGTGCPGVAFLARDTQEARVRTGAETGGELIGGGADRFRAACVDRGRVGTGEDVGIDEASVNRGSGEIPDPGIGRNSDVDADGGDAVVADEDGGLGELGTRFGEDPGADEGVAADGARPEARAGDGLRAVEERKGGQGEEECQRWTVRHGARLFRVGAAGKDSGGRKREKFRGLQEVV